MSRLDYPEAVVALIAELKRLPGVGPRSAERIAVWMIQHQKANPEELSKALDCSREMVSLCKRCGFFATQGRCDLCEDTGRDASCLCVVEHPTDVLPLERSGAFGGYYHCLGGKLSPLDNTSPDDLNISELLRRISSNESEDQEVILALSSDVEGEATANYLVEILEKHKCKVTRIAQGLPAGGGLEHADELTLMRALQGRR
ncbi:MAG: recombination mediator RecR [Akkermansiaceae bacterium]